VAQPDLAENNYSSALWQLVDGKPRQFTQSGLSNTQPTLSPDGSQLAFVRIVDSTSKPQLFVVPVAGGEPRALTEAPLGVGSFSWSADATKIVYLAPIPELGRYGTDEKIGAGAEAPRHITKLNYRLDGAGFLKDKQSGIHVVDVASAEVTQVTNGDFDVMQAVFSADDSWVYFIAPTGLADAENYVTSVYGIPVVGGEPVLLVEGVSLVETLSVADDGQLFFYGCDLDGNFTVAMHVSLWRCQPKHGATVEAVRITDEETVNLAPEAGLPVLVGNIAYVGVRHRGAVEVRMVPMDAGQALTLNELPVALGEQAVVNSFAVQGESVVASVALPDSPGEIQVFDGENVTTVTDFGAAIQEIGVREVRELVATGADGYPVHGWVILPEGDGPHPVLLNVHGGPNAYFGWNFFDEPQVYASAGYAVVMCNPRGSAGYGQEHGRSIVGTLGTVDAQDVLTFIDAALEMPELDSDRVAIMGGSYGGWMTTWLAGNYPDKFKAAWSERAVNDWSTFIGSSDIGFYFAEEYCGTNPVDLVAMSPMTYADNIRIPFAVAHSEQDWRCPLEQGQRLFVKLKRNKVDTEFWLFPGEGHELSRSGLPRHRVQRFEAILDWFGRKL
jgi:dipeptidyl aminopeptidase/acylaminoacyl peptidase